MSKDIFLSSHELVVSNVILDVFRDDFAAIGRHGFEVHGGKGESRVKRSETLGIIDDDAVPLTDRDTGSNDVVFAQAIFEFLVEHSFDFHAVVADGVIFERGENITAELVVVSAAAVSIATDFVAIACQLRKFADFVVFGFLFEAFAVGEKVKKLKRSSHRARRGLGSSVRRLAQVRYLPDLSRLQRSANPQLLAACLF
jgi:hypothetical protein